MTNKNEKDKILNDISLQVIAKSIFKETNGIGFTKADYIKLVNLILDQTLEFSDNGEDKIHKERPEKIEITDLPFNTKNLIIREFNSKKDKNNFKDWLQDEAGSHFLLTRTTPRKYGYDELINNPNDILGTITLQDKTPIGLMAFLDYDEEQKKAELRKLIGRAEYRGKGYGKEAATAWIQWGIKNLGLKKIYLYTINTNARNIRINQELGFQVEGILRNECLINGEYQDVLRMGLVVD